MESVTTEFAASSSSSATTHQSWTHDVFLSFTGVDTRNTFVSHLNSKLVLKGFKTFLDDDGLRRGEDISSGLHKAIQESKASIVVFSENYAFSKWCLEELVKILECKESKQQMVYPVFYKVDPADVRQQKGSFGKALADHECILKDQLEKVVRWREALTKAANLSGLHFSDGGDESKCIDAILEGVSAQLLRRRYLHVAKYPVGIDSRVEDVLKLLNIRGNDVQMVGIWGVGGMGKTTLAKAVYNSVAYQFEGSCFLANVREESLTFGGFVCLQKIMFSDILGWKSCPVSTVDQGIDLIRQYMSKKRALLILDDVNHLDQLNNLVGNPNWFGSGSRIIVTTRDKHCLTGHDVSEIYEVEKLSHHEALQLFNLNAFQDHRHMEDYVELVKNVLLYAQGLPLALKVLAANLRGRDVTQWKYALDSYRSLPKQAIHEVLKISYQALEHSIKEVFLHIACFFKGKSKNYVTQVLKACDLNPEYAIDLLEEKALIVVTEDDRLQMHDLIEEMGREIVFQESPNEPGQRSRLWRYEDVSRVFEKNTGSDKVQGIVVNSRNDMREKICLSGKSFSKLKNLQVFIISGDIFTRDHVNYLSNELRILDWSYCPLLSFPSNFNPKNLVLLKISSSQTSPLGEVTKILFQLKMPWSSKAPLAKGVEIMQSLKSIDLSQCYGLTKLAHFSRFPNLVDLDLHGCENLAGVDPSIGFLNNLVSLNLGFCGKLKKFEIMKEMKSLKCLDLRCSAIKEISSSIAHLVSLEKLTLRGCTRLTNVSSSIFELRHLRHLDLCWCDSLVTFPTKSGFSTSLRGKHYDPLFISLNRCTNIEEISEFPREIDGLNLSGCCALETISKLSNIWEGKDSKMIPRMNLKLCRNLAGMTQNHLRDDSSESIQLSALFLSCQQSEFEVLYPVDKLLPEEDPLSSEAESAVPLWFSQCFNGQKWPAYKLKIEFPGDFNWENKGLAFSAQSYETSPKHLKSWAININGVRIKETFEEKQEGQPWWLVEDHLWLYYVPFHTIIRRLSESGLPPPSICRVNFEFEVVEAKSVTCGIHIVMPEDYDGFDVDNSDRGSEDEGYDGVIIHQVDNSDRGSEDEEYYDVISHQVDNSDRGSEDEEYYDVISHQVDNSDRGSEDDIGIIDDNDITTRRRKCLAVVFLLFWSIFFTSWLHW